MSKSRKSLTNMVSLGTSATSVFLLLFCPFVVVKLLPFTYPEKTEEDVEREARLVEQWVGLAEERNAVLVPAPGSGIPGAPADW